jgi:hypothetical protein
MLPEHWTKRARSARMAFLAVLVLIGAVALYNWTVAPHRNYLLAANRYESAAEELATKSQAISNNVGAKRKKLGRLREKLEQIQGKLFGPAEAEQFFGSLQAEAGEANCIISSLSFPPAGSVSNINNSGKSSCLTIRQAKLSISGDCRNVADLLNTWQGGSKQVYINSVRIGSDRQNSGQVRCDLTVTIYVSHRKEEHQYD